jgi:hypothetical protein
MLLRRITLSVATASIFILQAGCDPITQPVSNPPKDQIATSTLGKGRSVQIRTLRDELREIALRAPGFSGLWIDDDGGLRLSASVAALNPSLVKEARNWLTLNRRPDLATSPIRLHRVSHDYAELYAWLEAVGPALARVPGVSSIGIDERTGRIHVGVDDGRARSLAIEAASGRVPATAFVAEVLPRAVDSGLHDTFSAMGGGIQITRGIGACSAGFVGWRRDPDTLQPDYEYKVLFTASHCTSDQFNVVGNVFGQPTVMRPVGVEVDESRIYYAPGCPNGYQYCRHADVAVIKLADSIPINAFAVAWSSPTVHPNNPPVYGWYSYSGSGFTGVLQGDSVIKVGRTTGETRGRVGITCADRQSTQSPGLWTICAMNATATGDGGDSGGPVYVRYKSSDPATPRAAGMTFQAGTGSVWFNSPARISAGLTSSYVFE